MGSETPQWVMTRQPKTVPKLRKEGLRSGANNGVGQFKYLNVHEAAEFLGVAAGTLRNWVTQSKYLADPLPFTKFSARCLRFNSKDLVEWAARRKSS